MSDSMIGRIRPGAMVECTDGPVGSVLGVETDASGKPEFLKMTRGWTVRELLVPFHLVDQVQQDGTVRLSCPREAIAQLAASSPASGPGPLADEALGPFEAPELDRPIKFGPPDREAAEPAAPAVSPDLERTIELKEEELVPRKELREVGQAEIRTEVEEVPGRLQVDAYSEEVEVVPIGRVVAEKVGPWEEDGALIVPVYEEQLVVTKRLVLREHLRIRRLSTTETRLYEDTLRRERLVIEDPNQTGLVHERFPTDDGASGERSVDRTRDAPNDEQGGFFEKVVRKAFE
jgi:uncharacterized protein (TIGR02271 family)